MEFVDTAWWQQNGLTVFLIALALVQWIGLQALIIHYHFFRKSLKKPRPDGVRMSLLEQTTALQGEQLEKIFSKLATLNREIDQLHVRQSQTSRTRGEANQAQSPSIETSMASLGELALKKRIQEIEGGSKLVQ